MEIDERRRRGLPTYAQSRVEEVTDVAGMSCLTVPTLSLSRAKITTWSAAMGTSHF